MLVTYSSIAVLSPVLFDLCPQVAIPSESVEFMNKRRVNEGEYHDRTVRRPSCIYSNNPGLELQKSETTLS
jgi:hypothetical protein